MQNALRPVLTILAAIMVDRLDLGHDLSHIPKDRLEPVYTVSIHCGNIHAVFCARGPRGKNRYDLPPVRECAGQVNAVIIAILQFRQSRANLFADLCNSGIERDRIGSRLVGKEYPERRRHDRGRQNDHAEQHKTGCRAARRKQQRGQGSPAPRQGGHTTPQPVNELCAGVLKGSCLALLPFALHGKTVATLGRCCLSAALR